MSEYEVRAPGRAEQDWLAATLADRWGGELIVGRGRSWRLCTLPALIALERGSPSGVLTYELAADYVEIVTLDALRPGRGIGRALLTALCEVARSAGLSMVQVMTTNDNLRALRFYQRAGFRISDIRLGAVDQARTLKPTISQLGNDDIPIRDEIDLVLDL